DESWRTMWPACPWARWDRMPECSSDSFLFLRSSCSTSGLPRSCHGCPCPWAANPVASLPGADGLVVAQGQPDVVEAVEQAVLAQSFDLESNPCTAAGRDRLRGQVDRDRRAARGLARDGVNGRFAQPNRQDAVLEAIRE